MADHHQSARTGMAAALSLLGLSLGVTGADAQTQPGTPPAANPQGVLIGLDQPGSTQIKNSTQIKSTQLKADMIDPAGQSSAQVKGESQQIKSMSLKFDSNQVKGTESNQWKAPESNQQKGTTSTQQKGVVSNQVKL